MTESDPILDAKTVQELMRAVNERFRTNLPTSFPSDSVLGQLWAVAIRVQEGETVGVLYTAESTVPFPFGPQSAPGLSGLVRIEIRDDVLSLRNGARHLSIRLPGNPHRKRGTHHATNQAKGTAAKGCRGQVQRIDEARDGRGIRAGHESLCWLSAVR